MGKTATQVMKTQLKKICNDVVKPKIDSYVKKCKENNKDIDIQEISEIIDASQLSEEAIKKYDMTLINIYDCDEILLKDIFTHNIEMDATHLSLCAFETSVGLKESITTKRAVERGFSPELFIGTADQYKRIIDREKLEKNIIEHCKKNRYEYDGGLTWMPQKNKKQVKEYDSLTKKYIIHQVPNGKTPLDVRNEIIAKKTNNNNNINNETTNEAITDTTNQSTDKDSFDIFNYHCPLKICDEFGNTKPGCKGYENARKSYHNKNIVELGITCKYSDVMRFALAGRKDLIEKYYPELLDATKMPPNDDRDPMSYWMCMAMGRIPEDDYRTTINKYYQNKEKKIILSLYGTGKDRDLKFELATHDPDIALEYDGKEKFLLIEVMNSYNRYVPTNKSQKLQYNKKDALLKENTLSLIIEHNGTDDKEEWEYAFLCAKDFIKCKKIENQDEFATKFGYQVYVDPNWFFTLEESTIMLETYCKIINNEFDTIISATESKSDMFAMLRDAFIDLRSQGIQINRDTIKNIVSEVQKNYQYKMEIRNEIIQRFPRIKNNTSHINDIQEALYYWTKVLSKTIDWYVVENAIKNRKVSKFKDHVLEYNSLGTEQTHIYEKSENLLNTPCVNNEVLNIMSREDALKTLQKHDANLRAYACLAANMVYLYENYKDDFGKYGPYDRSYGIDPKLPIENMVSIYASAICNLYFVDKLNESLQKQNCALRLHTYENERLTSENGQINGKNSKPIDVLHNGICIGKLVLMIRHKPYKTKKERWRIYGDTTMIDYKNKKVNYLMQVETNQTKDMSLWSMIMLDNNDNAEAKPKDDNQESKYNEKYIYGYDNQYNFFERFCNTLAIYDKDIECDQARIKCGLEPKASYSSIRIETSAPIESEEIANNITQDVCYGLI